MRHFHIDIIEVYPQPQKKNNYLDTRSDEESENSFLKPQHFIICIPQLDDEHSFTDYETDKQSHTPVVSSLPSLQNYKHERCRNYPANTVSRPSKAIRDIINNLEPL